MGEEDEEDSVLSFIICILRESQLRKVVAAAAAAARKVQRKRTHSVSYASTRHCRVANFISGSILCCFNERCGECCEEQNKSKRAIPTDDKELAQKRKRHRYMLCILR